MGFKVLIPTAGTGSRLGELTQYLNKSLITIANRPVLSLLVEQFPEDSELVVALGHKGGLVREFLSIAYPRRNFLFKEVKPFEGPGSGLGLSILFCKEYLQEPFIFCSCDTLVEGRIPPPDRNWMGYTKINDIRPYRTLILSGDRVSEINEKGNEKAGAAAYIGLSGIKDYKEFWDLMEADKEAILMGEVHGMRSLLKKGIQGVPFIWWDTGNKEALMKTREKYKLLDSPNILDKPNEAIWFVGENVIKFSADEKFIRDRVERASRLSGFCPPVSGSTEHMYRYKKIDGRVLSEVVTVPLFKRFLDFTFSFWKQNNLSPDEKSIFQKNCLSFYKEKTYRRVHQFYETFGVADGTEPINGEPMPTLASLLDGLNWEWMSDGLPGRFHGDLHFENILWSEKTEKFAFLDWRQNFGGSLAVGDIYYDLAKLLHGLIVCHELIAKGLFKVEWSKNEIKFNLLRRQTLLECEDKYESWLSDQNYDVRKIKILTSLIFLNIAALHHHPYCLLLYALGKKMLKENARGTK